ncbi:hypothetical protein Ahy_B09g095640 isoform B [Arachis hypogaea]|uniref:GTP cyclohydrolase 1 n=1 Tax=Arachis hypogaea TaxID=3818 RepID=A0A444XFV0_ARAHY|nr:hypothetical protein Ahy_B09g095640 isoform B [Arachis hypogaea]
MGCLDEGHFNGELENELSIGLGEVGFDEERVAAIGDAVKLLLQGLGEDVNREGLRKTPLRVAKALLEGTRGYRQKVNEIVGDALFPEAGLDNNRIGHAGGAGGLVVVRDLDHFSYCESCLLPFQIKCHVGYVPSGKRVLGLSKLSRSIVHFYGFKLQLQEQLTRQIAETISPLLGGNVIVVVEASHTCMISRGIEKFGSSTSTIAVLGHFSTDRAARAAFLQSIPTPTYCEGQ